MSTNGTINSTQQLIDQRLDAIDRALLGLLSRNDRLAVVAQLEKQLRELAGAGTAVEFGAPPESTLLPPDIASRSPTASRLLSSQVKRSSLAVSSGILGIVALISLFVLPISFVLASAFGEMYEEAAIALMGTHLATVVLCGTLAVALGIAGLVVVGRRNGELVGRGWAITGLCTGPLPMFAGGLMVLVAGFQSLAVQSVQVTNVATSAGPSNNYPPGAPVPMMSPVQDTPMAQPYGAPPSPVPNGFAPYVAEVPSSAQALPPPNCMAPPELLASPDCPRDSSVVGATSTRLEGAPAEAPAPDPSTSLR